MPKPGPRATYKYSDEFKATAVRLREPAGVELQDVAASLYIHPFMLSRWRKQAREGQIVTKEVEVDKQVAAEIKELRKIMNDSNEENKMNLGAFSVSLTVKDIEASKKFYEKLGFESFGGDCGQGWTILKNGDHVIGLFQGMFEKNMLTFNPGWNQDAQNVDEFTDVRELRDELIRQGITVVSDDAKQDAGPGSLLIEDPDGNPILIDQHR